MALTLTIENETSLPDGGPLSVSVTGKRGLDFGRDQHLDWTLPDPSRFISGKHCEVRYKDGGYWLYDVSTNGTFLNGAEGRLKGPHRLRNGDRLTIGHYIVGVTLDGEEAARAPELPAQPVAYHELWKSTEDSAPPLDPALLRPPAERAPVHPDFLDWATDIPETRGFEPDIRPAAPPPAGDPWGDAQPARPASAPRPNPIPASPPPTDDLDWAQGAPRQQPAPEPPPPVPTPRRPAVWVANEPGGPWNSPAAAPPAEAPMPPPAMPPQPETAPVTASMPGPAPQAQAPLPASAPVPLPIAGDGADMAAFVRRLAEGAGVPESIFTQQNPDELAQQLGTLMRVVVENLRQLLQARLQAKRLARSSNQTMVEAFDNNPLKFSPSAEDAMRIMFGPPNRSYLDAHRTIEQSFQDVKTHQMKTYAAMQQALRMLLADLDPQAIEQETDPDRGIAAMVGSRKSRLWDVYQARWQAKSARQEGGLIDAFMLYFAECYDRGGNDLR